MNAQKNASPEFTILVKNLVELIEKGNAHISLDKALENIPFALLGERPDNLPYSIWQITEHIRIAQWDILEFSRNAKHISPEWPDGYWVKETKPQSDNDWTKSIEKIKTERNSFIELIKNAGDDLYIPFEHGTGQSLLKEALVLADHNSYHCGEIIVIRRLLHAWN
ncbi:MAG TPA: DinB family protein [Ginsengibacter sp.]